MAKIIPLDEKTLRISTGRIERAWEMLRKHPLTGPLIQRAKLRVLESPPQNQTVFCWVNPAGEIFANPWNHLRRNEEWAFAIAHCLLHLAFGHLHKVGRGMVWNICCDCVINEFLFKMRIGSRPDGMLQAPPGLPNDEEKLYLMWRDGARTPTGVTCNGASMDMISGAPGKVNWADIFSRAIRRAAKASLNAAAGDELMTQAGEARAWFVKNYPLIGGILQHFRLVEDAKLCEKLGVRVAAVYPQGRDIFINPGWAMEPAECRFVLAHMALHGALQHHRRKRSRESFLWNIACDYCVNSWLNRMPLFKRDCRPPGDGWLFSEVYQDMSPEKIYPLLLAKAKANIKLVTFAGEGVSDVLSADHEGLPTREFEESGADASRLLLDGLLRGSQIHMETMREALPYSLMEEVRSLEHPPEPWDSQLGRWFDENVPPVERIRTYARPSRRQDATPGIPRPRHVWPDFEVAQKATFGLIVDGRFPQPEREKALGAIASYCLARNIPAVRLMFAGNEITDFDTVGTDVLPAMAADSDGPLSKIKTALDEMERTQTLTDEAPVLFITGTPCERVETSRAHGYLLTEGANLTYPTTSAVIEMDGT